MKTKTTPLDKDIRAELQEMGIFPCEPDVRSSDYKLVRKDPFMYFLVRKCGLVPAFSWSEALSRGGWFAERMLYARHPNPSSPMAEKLRRRLDELGEISSTLNLNPDARHTILEREKKDYACAIGWYEASRDIPMIEGLTYEKYFSQSHWRHLGSEVLCRVKWEGIPITCRFDHLYYNEKNHRVWIVDDKTTGYDPHVRVQICPNEFQSQLYTFALRIAIREGLLDKFELGPDLEIGGIWHVAIQKPTIDFGSRDRPYRYVSDGKRKNRRGSWDPSTKELKIFVRTTGHPVEHQNIENEAEAIAYLHEKCGKKPDKSYEGEPDLDLYMRRCREWYHGEGEYENLMLERGGNPPVAFSWLGKSWVDGVENETKNRILQIQMKRREEIKLSAYPKSEELLTIGGKLIDYAPLYVNPVEKWPSIILDNRLIIRHRDEHSLVDDFILEPTET